MDEDQRDAYSAFAAAHWRRLVRSAVLLGCDQHGAEDLAQATLVRCYVKWALVKSADDRNAYVARVMLNLHRQAYRRWWSRELPTAEFVDRPAMEPPPIDGADVVRRALDVLSREQREVVVLRIHLQMPEREAAAVLGVPAGTVKSRLSRALARLAADPDLIDLNHGADG